MISTGDESSQKEQEERSQEDYNDSSLLLQD
jgi:hypothetical protein